jgi:hypothetical protein
MTARETTFGANVARLVAWVGNVHSQRLEDVPVKRKLNMHMHVNE